MTNETPTYSILVVEDNPDIVIGLQDLLQHDGYAVSVAGTCAEARAQIRAQPFNAVLLDLQLPDGDGSDLLKEIQELDASVPVVILTAHIAQERTVGSLVKGAFGYLTKPYNREELRQTLRRAIGVKELAVKAEHAEHLLIESEDRFRSLVESASDAIILADSHGAIISWNRAASVLFGYTLEEVVGQPLALLMPQRYRRAHQEGIARMASTGKSRVIGSVVELDGLRKNGMEFPIELSLATWKTSAGSFYSGIIRDISQRKQTEKAFKQLEHQHTLILNQAGEGIYGLDVDGCTTFVNMSAAGLLGYPVEELLGRPMHQLIHHTTSSGNPYPVEACPIYAAFRDGQVHRVGDEVFWRKDGSSFPVEYVSTPIKDGDTIVGAVVVFHDITDRVEAERALRLSEERLELVIHGSDDGFWDGRVLPDEPWYSPRTPVWYSSRFKTMLGCSDAEFPHVLESWLSRLHSDDRERVFEALRAHIDQRIPYDVEYRLKTKENGYHWFRTRGQAVWNHDGRMVRMSGSLQSTMDRRRAEETARRGEHLLHTLAYNTTAVIYIKDVDGRFLLVNRRFEELFCVPSEQIIGRTNHEIFPKAVADTFRINDLEVISRKQTIEYEESAPHQDGLHTYLSIKFPLCDEGGEVYATGGISTDITERKRMEEALRTHYVQLRLALKATDVGVWDWDLLTGRLFWSSQVNRFFARDGVDGSLTVNDWLSRVHPDERDEFGAALLRIKDQSEDEVLLGHRMRGQDGTVRRVVWTGHIMRDRNKQAIHILGTFGTSDEQDDQESSIYSPWTGM